MHKEKNMSPLVVSILSSYFFISFATATGISNAPSQYNVSCSTLFLSSSCHADLTNSRGSLYLEATTKILGLFFI